MISDNDEYFLEELADIDQQIENYVKKISTFLNKFNAEDEILESAREQHIHDIHSFLKETHILIHSYQGLEEFLLPHIGEFRKQNGLCLLTAPCRSCHLCKNPRFNLDECEPLSLWEQLISHLEKFVIQELELENKAGNLKDCGTNLIRVKSYVNLLQEVYVPETCWNMHSKYRTVMLEHHLSGCNQSCFVCFLKLCIHCISEDQLLLHSGDFYPVPITWTTLLNLYFAPIQEQYKNLITELKQWCKFKNHLPLTLELLLHCEHNLPQYYTMCVNCCLLKDVFLEHCAALQSFACLSKPNTNEDFNFLYSSIVLQLIKLMYKFELQVDVLSSGELPRIDALHIHEFDLEVVSQGTDFTLPSDSPESSPVHENLVLSKSASENFDSFSKNWRLTVVNSELLTQMQRLLQNSIQEITQRHIEEEKSLLLLNKVQLLYGRKRTYELCSVELELNTVLQSVLVCVKELERFVPLLYSSEGPLFPFKASFCHAVNTYVTDLLKHIEFISRGPPQNFSVYYIYVAASTAIFLQERLSFYNSLVFCNSESESESLIKHICEKADELAKDLKEETFLQSIKYTSCGILFDSNSYNFEDTKPFYEGERVSYSVQMFNLHMRASLSDMQFYLPQKIAQEIYARVLCESLMQLAYRYAHSSPTEARTPQVQSDIIGLLLCMSELIYPACLIAAQFSEKNPEEKFEDETSIMVARIHSTCCVLLSTMAILASPLPELYEIFGRGFPVPPLSLRTRFNFIMPWLPWIRPHLFPDCGQSILMSTVKVWFAVKACTSWLQLHPAAIIKAFTEHYCTLSILVMSQASYLCNSNNGTQASSKEMEERKTKLATSVYRLLSCYESQSNCLSNIFLPVLERTNDWIEFDGKNIDTRANERPWWFKGLVEILKPYMKNVLSVFLPTLRQCRKKFASTDVLTGWKMLKNMLEPFVTCTCDDTFDYCSQSSTSASGNSLSFTCISNLLENVDDFLIAVPVPIKMCMATLDIHFLNYVSEAEPVRQSLPIQILLSIIISYLNDPKLLSDLVGCEISPAETSLCTFITETLKAVLVKADVSVDISAEQVTQIERRLSHIAKHFKDLRNNADNFKSPKNLEGLEDELVKLTAVSLLKRPDGIDTVTHLQKILCLNESWIQSSLGISEMLSSDSVINVISPTPLPNMSDLQAPGSSGSNTSSKRASIQRETSLGIRIDSGGTSDGRNTIYESHSRDLGESATFPSQLNLNTNEFHLRGKLDFNPFMHFDHLGECSFKDAMKFTVPWEALLSHLPILGLTETNLCALMEQRWDIRGEGPVPRNQKEFIQNLKKKYDLLIS